MTHKIVKITIIGLLLALLSFSAFSHYTGWDIAEVRMLERNTFEINDEVKESTFQEKEVWVEEIRNEVFKEKKLKFNGLTIAIYE